MNAPARIPLSDEVRIGHEVANQLIAAGIDTSDEHYSELFASGSDLPDRLLRILRAARHTEAQSTALKQIEIDMKVRRDRLDNKALRLRGIVLQAMSDLGLKRLEGPDLSASIGAGRAKVVVTEDHLIPEQFFVHSRALDKKALAAALKDEAIPGASLSNGEPSLTLRSR